MRYVSLGLETTYGTAVIPTEPLDMISETIQKTYTHEDITSQRVGGLRYVEPLNSSIGGEIVCVGNFNDIGLILKHYFGSATTSGGGPTYYTHTFPASTGVTTRAGMSLTVEVERDDGTPSGTTGPLTTRYAGSKVVGLSLSASRDQSPQLTFGIVAKSETHGVRVSGGVTYPDFKPMLVSDMTVTVDGATLALTDFSLTSARPVDAPFVMGTETFHKEPVDAGPFTVEFEATVLLEDMTEYNKIGTVTDVAVLIDATTHSMTINLNKAQLIGGAQNISGRESLVQTIQGRAYFDTTATSPMQIVLVNVDATIP